MQPPSPADLPVAPSDDTTASCSPPGSHTRRKIAYHHPALRRTDSLSSVWSDVTETYIHVVNAKEQEAHHEVEPEEDSGYISPLSFDDEGDEDYRRRDDYDATEGGSEYDAAEMYFRPDSDDDEYESYKRDNHDASDLHHCKTRPSIILLDDLLNDVQAFKSDKNYAPTLKSQRSRAFISNDTEIEVIPVVPLDTPVPLTRTAAEPLVSISEIANAEPRQDAELHAVTIETLTGTSPVDDRTTSKETLVDEPFQTATPAADATTLSKGAEHAVNIQRTYRAPDPRPKVAKTAALPKKKGLKRLIRKLSRRILHV
ncbi:hypothetical protein HDU86_005832 [Geranomyces michiganensis]|nr:hypothetical protein HDU86_005832 [Geranomyces michiganensis]